jgi:lipopolysaccharide biosynthesis regulator YciM
MEGYEQDLLEKLKERILFTIIEKNNQKAMETLERVVAEDDLSVAATLMYTTQLLPNEDKYNEALEALQRALEIRVKKLGENHVKTAETYECIGRVFLEKSRSDVPKGCEFHSRTSVTRII